MSGSFSLYPHLFARAYISFKNQEDIVLFRDRFDGYVFIDHRGKEGDSSEINESFLRVDQIHNLFVPVLFFF